jgi:hypothetical protein
MPRGSRWAERLLARRPQWLGAGRIDLFARGVDNALVHKWWDGERWSEWENLGGALSSGPAVASWGAGRLDVFVRGNDNSLYHR